MFSIREQVVPGAPPGTLVIDPQAQPPRFVVLAFDEASCEEAALTSAAEVAPWLGKKAVVWIHVTGLGDAAELQRLADLVGLHRLALEDVVHVHQRPKVEEYEDRLFIVARGAAAVDGGAEQVSILVGSQLVVSFEERSGPRLDGVRERIREGRGRIRANGPDYVAYALLDAIVDAYFPVLDDFGERLEALEDAAASEPHQETIARIHDAKHDVLHLRRVLWSTREMLSHLVREDTPAITENTRVYLRDCLDHTVQLLDIVETFHETAFGLTDVYLSNASLRMNEIMKVLTIIATIFIPLTFISGIYGMNFAVDESPWNMPELHWYFGYPLCLGLMVAIAGALVLYFRRLGWIGGGLDRRPTATTAREVDRP